MQSNHNLSHYYLMENINLTDSAPVLFTLSTTVDLTPTAQKNEQPILDTATLKLSDAAQWLKIYYTPSLITFGALGNVASIAILLYTNLATLPCARYLATCTIVDTIFLLNLLVTWLVELGYPIFKVGALCHATTFAQKASAFLSVWYTVSYSVDSLIGMKFPNAERQLCTVFRAKLVCTILAIVAVVVYLNTSLLMKVMDYHSRQACMANERFGHVQKRLDQIDAFVNVIVPYIALICISISYAAQCYKDEICQRRGPHRPPQRSIHVDCDIEAGLTSLYFTFVLVHLLTNLPLKLMSTIMTISEMSPWPLELTLKRYLVEESLTSLYHSKFASNALVYVFAWKGFRDTLTLLLTRLRRCLLPCIGNDAEARLRETTYVDYGIDEAGMALCSTEKLRNGSGIGSVCGP